MVFTHLADNTHLCTPKLVIFPSDASWKVSISGSLAMPKAVDCKDNDFERKIKDAEKRSYLFYCIVWLFAYLLAYLFIRLFILLNFQLRLAFCFVFLLVFVFKLLMWLRTTVLTFTNISGVLHFPVSSSHHLFIRYLCRLYKLIIKT